MENFVRNSKLNIEKEIKRIEQQPIALLERIKQIIDVIQTSLTLLKRAVAEYQFQNPEEEIQFFTADFRLADVLYPFISD